MRRILFMLIFGLAGLGVLLSLGIWQMQRLAWKQDIINQIDMRVAAAPVGLPANPDPVSDKYLPVAVSGTLLPQELHVLVSRKHIGAGYRIIAPFELSDGRRIMVDRGFTKAEMKGTARTDGMMQITGNLHWPIEIDGFTPEPDKSANIWFARDVPEMARALGTDPVLIVARTQSDPSVTPLPVDSSAMSNDHLQYAITWFSLAFIWAAMTTYFLWRTRANAES
jgi:surfeit locus 1 family protein